MKTKNPQVNIFNRQRKTRVDTRSLQVFAASLCARLELKSGFSIVLVSDKAMKRYNRDFAGKDKTTDVLSFPSGQEAWEIEDESYAGDILISVQRADQQKSGDLLSELKILCLHGLLHLLGYDHECDGGEMMALESRLREELQLQ